jgi:hypothetical protein
VGGWYSYESLLKRLAQDLQDLAAELRQLIQEEDAVVGPRHFTWHWHLAAADQPDIRDGLVGRPQWTHDDTRGAVAGEPGDVVMMRAGLA